VLDVWCVTLTTDYLLAFFSHIGESLRRPGKGNRSATSAVTLNFNLLRSIILRLSFLRFSTHTGESFLRSGEGAPRQRRRRGAVNHTQLLTIRRSCTFLYCLHTCTHTYTRTGESFLRPGEGASCQRRRRRRREAESKHGRGGWTIRCAATLRARLEHGEVAVAFVPRRHAAAAVL
jgi:hypothetical protein